MRARIGSVDSYRMVLPAHLNHFGKLMGGWMLHWVDEVAWCAARLDFPGCDFVTVGMDAVAFHHAVPAGAVLRLSAERSRRGEHSVGYAIAVTMHDGPTDEAVFTTTVSLVRVDPDGAKRPLPPC